MPGNNLNNTKTSDTGPDRGGLNAATLTALIQQRLDQREPDLSDGAFCPPSDFDLNPEALSDAREQIAGRPAAVLVPILARQPLTLLFTQRRDDLPVHSGQISFPGGKREHQDQTLTETALREAQEEIGLAANDVKVTGYLDPYHTATGFLIAPVVALISPTFVAKADPREVSEVFEVPLAFFLNPENHQIKTKVLNNKPRKFYAMPYDDRYIWGATAGILHNFYQRISGT